MRLKKRYFWERSQLFRLEKPSWGGFLGKNGSLLEALSTQL
jgi:hypothetical protein